jgi:DNA-binding CsgD family transcriptional regulator
VVLGTTEETVRELLALAYEAGAAPERWPRFLEALGRSIGDRAVTVQVENFADASGSLVAATRVDPAYAAAYVEHFAPLNPWIRGQPDTLHAGAVLVGEAVVPRSELVHTEFYADFLRPQGVVDSIAAVVERDNGTTALVTVARSSRCDWNAWDAQLLQTLVPHLRRAFALHRWLGSRRQTHEALVETADRLPWGVVFVDARGRVCFVNAVARKIGRSLMARILGVARGGGGVVDRSERSPLAVTVAPLHVEEDPLLRARPMRSIFIIDPDEPRPSASVLLRRGYGLTSAEARLAAALARGESLRDIAEATGVGPETVRSHLKRVFAKTGTRRQSELVRLLILLSPREQGHG